MKISPDWTAEERQAIACVMCFANRRVSMATREKKLPYSSEALLTLLCASAVFLEKQRASFEKVLQNETAPDAAPAEVVNAHWQLLSSDIKKFFPGQFTDEDLGLC